MALKDFLGKRQLNCLIFFLTLFSIDSSLLYELRSSLGRGDILPIPTFSSQQEFYIVQVLHFPLLFLCWGLVVEGGYCQVEELLQKFVSYCQVDFLLPPPSFPFSSFCIFSYDSGDMQAFLIFLSVSSWPHTDIWCHVWTIMSPLSLNMT